NPFENSFALDLKTSSTTPVTLAIYDMTGRLLDTKEIKAEGLSTQTIGERYPAGVYNVIVTQGDNMQTVRVVKR
ncbi:T9SS type A sorting domain-containing protein, partial [Flavobacterium sp.]|uniref:T9SS type A sorting domain-containing protein n=1 Tax=Flavobacterium sp. TaxID=239 RepID=UPI0025B9AF68